MGWATGRFRRSAEIELRVCCEATEMHLAFDVFFVGLSWARNVPMFSSIVPLLRFARVH